MTLLYDVVDTPLSANQSVVLRELIESNRVSMDHLVNALYGWREDGGALCARSATAHVVRHVKQKLRPDYVINGDARHGFLLECVR